MHGARRKLSEPRIAGKAWAVWLSSQCLTSAGDSLLFIPACVISRTFRQEGKAISETCKKSGILRAILHFETETRLEVTANIQRYRAYLAMIKAFVAWIVAFIAVAVVQWIRRGFVSKEKQVIS